MKINVRIDGLHPSVLQKIDNSREKSTPKSNLFNSDHPELMTERGGRMTRRGGAVVLENYKG
jgi:hypothetical protein